MIKKTILLTALLATSTFSFAASEIRDSQVAGMKDKIGNISVNVKNGTFEEAMMELSNKADRQGAGYYRITSLEYAGMGSNIRATAAIYK